MEDKILKAKLEKCIKILQQLEAVKGNNKKIPNATENKHFKGKKLRHFKVFIKDRYNLSKR